MRLFRNLLNLSRPITQPLHQLLSRQHQIRTPSSAPTGSTTPPAVASNDDLQVKLEASTGDCWVRFQADDAPAEQTIIKQGQTQAVPPAKSAVKVTYGNRQSLKVIINNREATLPETLPKFKGQIIISRDTLASFFQPQAATPE